MTTEQDLQDFIDKMKSEGTSEQDITHILGLLINCMVTNKKHQKTINNMAANGSTEMNILRFIINGYQN